MRPPRRWPGSLGSFAAGIDGWGEGRDAKMEVAEIVLVSGVPFVLGFVAGYAVRAAISRVKRKRAQGF